MELDANLIAKVTSYQPSTDRLDGVHSVPLLFIVGTSGAGKDTLMGKILDEHPHEYHKFITHTTRKPRNNNGVLERNGVDYHFIDFATSNDMLDRRDYIEANVFSGNIYGSGLTEMEEALQEDKIVISDIDVNGVANFIRLGLNVKPVFVLPPSYDVWQERLLRRYEGHEIDKSDWLRRMKIALHELQFALDDDSFYLVVNDDLEATVETIDAIAHGNQTQEHRPALAKKIAQEIIQRIKFALNG